MYNLDASTREKPVIDVDDIYLILHHHWVVDTAIFPDGRQRVQIALLVLEMAYTATRPAALVYVRRNEKRVKGRVLVRMTRMKMRKTIKKGTMERATKTVTGARNTIKHYAMGTSRCCYSLTRTASETY
jgi:hypothetical protein